MAEEELKRIAVYKEKKSKGKVADLRTNILMLGLSPPDYLLRAASNVYTNELEQTLLVSAMTFVH
ncbi:WD repeat-containing 3 [Olea europaea subsp. europaea]|uniref:WD repeat-containing 3 n=1 Tax=Olea europaea subsp. europaea TaxID=158383 RepID=A0A8S0SUB3_OLEEU|nr:WD repeat-containing 3 [Olea europaea subsp. europaea]